MIKQSGTSLVGLMVGMLLSMIAVLASLAMYQSLGKVAIDSKKTANYNAQLATMMAIVKREVQNAGYGIEEGEVSGPNFYKKELGDYTDLVWRYKDDDGEFHCRRLQFNFITNQIELTELVGDLCKNSPNISQGKWPVIEVLASVPAGDIGKLTPLFKFKVKSLVAKECSPFGQSTGSEHQELKIDVENAARREQRVDGEPAADLLDPTTHTLCLTNLYAGSVGS